ncbi:MAG: phosphopyruvate hydratase [Candidatus Pacebacteria bacterium]|nr:phosphopyruvate hydratase [Candidatus Paceibacterota bacterium]
MAKGTIRKIQAREILDSRGNPTIETRVELEEGDVGIASVPSGTAVGRYEAFELRDHDPKRYRGMGVLSAVNNVHQKIAPVILGQETTNQKQIDQQLIQLDGSRDKSKLGVNAILSVSQAVCRAGANVRKVPLYQHVADLFGEKKEMTMPVPLFNLINGGKHGAGNLDFQEFLILPFFQTFAKALQAGSEIYHLVGEVLIRHGAIHSVGDEGGFAPNLFTNLDAFEVLIEAIKESGIVLGQNVFLGLDVAATFFYQNNRYRIRDRSVPLTPGELIDYYADLNRQYPLYLLEDGLVEDDWSGWQELTARLNEVVIVGDDLLVTNRHRIKQAARKKACSAILVKPNQVGTISESLEVVRAARKAKWKVIVSHRSGETEDNFIADFALGVGADMVKFGAPARGERVMKYNRLLMIEEELKKNARL